MVKTVKKKTKNDPFISVVMPCYNARRTIAASLTAILNQKVAFDYEVIVVDCSDDGTEKIVQSGFPQVRLIHLGQLESPGSKRNLGVRYARGEIIAFTDSDCLPPPDWLAQIVDHHKRIDADGIGGCVINGYPHGLATLVSHLIEFNEWTERTPEGYMRNIPTSNLSFKRETFRKYQVCFMDIYPNEDTLFNWTLSERGAKIYFSPRLCVVHMKKVKMGNLLLHQFEFGKGSAETRRISSLPGKVFVKYPILCVGLPFIRWFKATLRFAECDLKTLLLFWLVTPFYLAAVGAWSLGFMTRGRYLSPGPRFPIEGPVADAPNPF